MQRINAKEPFIKKSNERKLFHSFTNRTNIMAYAAILVIGLIFGSVVTYLGTHDETNPDTSQISGTIAPLPDNTNYFNDEITKINLQKTQYGSLKLNTITIETKENIHFRVFSENNQITPDNFNLLFSTGNFEILSSSAKELSYSFSNTAIFQLVYKDTSPVSEDFTIQFMRNNLIISEFNLE